MRRGATSVKYSATPMARGVAINPAKNVITSEPTMSPDAPYWGLFVRFAPGSQVVLKKYPEKDAPPGSKKIRRAFAPIKIKMLTITTINNAAQMKKIARAT